MMFYSYELNELIKEVGIDSVMNMLSSFSVKQNSDVQSFIRNKCFEYEKSNNARSYLVMDNDMQAIAFFSISLSSLPIPENISNRTKHRMRGFGRSSADSIAVFLIGQLAREDNVTHNEINLSCLLDIIKNYILIVQDIVGGRCIAVDCIDKLVPLYEKNGFTKINKTDNLNQMIMFL